MNEPGRDISEMWPHELGDYAELLGVWNFSKDGHITYDELLQRVAIKRASLRGKEYRSR